MSNNEAIKLYETVIEDVISDSRQDFENNGIDESTLQDLRRIWCEKLSQSQVAKFSWDDEEAYGAGDAHVPNSSGLLKPGILPPGVGRANLGGSLGVNLNSGLGGSLAGHGDGLELPNVGNGDELSYGAVATPNNNIGIELPNIKQDEDNDSGLMLPNIKQSDGTFEFSIITENGPQIIDALKKKNRKIGQSDGTFDGGDDDDDEGIFNDSDDINSDLDDGLESEKSDDEDGEQEGQIMLCLYEKVQRIKNKWKSTLKEGVANINGKDYVFQKATGECEW